jgi:hypothetical protein
MRIFRAIGLGLAIVILKTLMPEVFGGFEATLVQFFGLAQHGIATAETSLPY